MIDVILYGRDQAGTLVVWERRFRSFRGLVHFFGSMQSARWDWAEVAHNVEDGRTRYVRYPAEGLRSMVVTAGWTPSPN